MQERKEISGKDLVFLSYDMSPDSGNFITETITLAQLEDYKRKSGEILGAGSVRVDFSGNKNGKLFLEVDKGRDNGDIFTFHNEDSIINFYRAIGVVDLEGLKVLRGKRLTGYFTAKDHLRAISLHLFEDYTLPAFSSVVSQEEPFGSEYQNAVSELDKMNRKSIKKIRDLELEKKVGK